MGSDQSSQTPNPLAFLACLQEKDLNSDHAFWVSLMSHATDRNLLSTPDSIFLNDIAAKYPLNFANLVLASVHEVSSIQKLAPGTELTAEQLNQLQLALQLFISCISVAIVNPKNSFLLEHLDSELYSRLKELSKKQANSNNEKASKKAKKNNTAGKTVKTNVTEKPNQPQTQEETATEPSKTKTSKKEVKKKANDEENMPAQEDAEEPIFDVKPREVVDINAPRIGKTYDEAPPSTTNSEKASNQPTTTKNSENAKPDANGEKPKKKASNAKRAASPQPSPKAEKNTSAANRAKSPQPKRVKRTPEEKAIIAQHRAMRQYDGHVMSSFVNAVIDILFKEGLTVTETKPPKAAKPKATNKNENESQNEQPKEKKPKKAKKTANPNEAAAKEESNDKKENVDTDAKASKENNSNENKENNNENNNNNNENSTNTNNQNPLLAQTNANLWLQNGEESKLREINITRKELIDALLLVSSLHIFYPKFKVSCPAATSNLLTNLPIEQIILSTCRVSFRYMNERPPVTSELSLLLRSCVALLVRLFTNAKFRKEISKIHPQIFLRAIYAPDFIQKDKENKDEAKKVSLPLFEPLDPLSKENLSFLYMVALFQPEFVPLLTSKGYSNMFLYNLIWAAQLFFEKENVNYIHSIILSTILLIVADQKAADFLNRPFKPSSKGAAFIHCEFKPSTDKGLTFGDLLLEVLLGFCQRDSFLPSLICVFHMISPYVNKFSLSTATKMMELFERVNEQFQSFVPLFLEVFATIVQQRNNKENGFCAVIFSKQALFKQINNDSPSVQKSLPIIQKYLKKARITVKKENKAKLELSEIAQILGKIDTEKLFPQPQTFIKHPHIFGGEIEKTWDQWADLIFQLNCEKEVKSIRQLRNSLLSKQNTK